MQNSQVNHTYFCWICGNPVDLKNCRSDEYGIAVHEDCYFLKVALATESMRTTLRKPPHGTVRIAKSDVSSRGSRPSAK